MSIYFRDFILLGVASAAALAGMMTNNYWWFAVVFLVAPLHIYLIGSETQGDGQP